MKKILLLIEDYSELSTTEVYLKKVGFDVVGISLDSDRGELQRYVEKEQLPWVQLFDGGLVI